ncbi:hypothetical protein BOTBODRAFT_58901 [Botryobasidium botryosum FD-172 SS1]|uniref:Mitochondrial splicing suppressor 51-like C-terminal domain-containing protein n=1 Tax=Botryobasidium botryosum (strain FD-172 SS1) TaxID=930990 RepID=A0A067MB62_BOTB1|nr:hypothetical protein BOTBODRAFT_58901 [Botryobasidium botryosum FD-172 SS1]
MSKLADLQKVLKQFPWGRIEADGSFNVQLALAMRDLLGDGLQFGWWSTVSSPDDYITHLDERSGWRLPPSQTPWLTFAPDRPAPPYPPKFAHNWTSYYAWRGLPMDSPAVLLLHWPLSIYRLLFLVGLAEVPEKRRSLVVHWIEPTHGLDFLPIFGELALLLPNTDIELILFSKEAHDLGQKSPSSLLYIYTAPPTSGGSTIRIRAASTPSWEPSKKSISSHSASSSSSSSSSSSAPSSAPHALISLNGSLSSHSHRALVHATSRALNIPLAATHLAQLGHDEDILELPELLRPFVTEPKLGRLFGAVGVRRIVDFLSAGAGKGWLEKKVEKKGGEGEEGEGEGMGEEEERAGEEGAVELNPFTRPGTNPPFTHFLPCAPNAFTCVFTKGEARY